MIVHEVKWNKTGTVRAEDFFGGKKKGKLFNN